MKKEYRSTARTKKMINAETVYRLAKVLGCTMEDLIENNTQ